jgi:type III secretion protein HrpB1
MHPARSAELPIPVVIALRSDRAIDALQLLNDAAPESFPKLRALCLHALADPTWHAHASSLRDDSDPALRGAMRKLLGEDEPPSEGP